MGVCPALEDQSPPWKQSNPSQITVTGERRHLGVRPLSHLFPYQALTTAAPLQEEDSAVWWPLPRCCWSHRATALIALGGTVPVGDNHAQGRLILQKWGCWRWGGGTVCSGLEGSRESPPKGNTSVLLSTELVCVSQEQPGHSLPHCFPKSASGHFVTWVHCHVLLHPGLSPRLCQRGIQRWRVPRVRKQFLVWRHQGKDVRERTDAGEDEREIRKSSGRNVLPDHLTRKTLDEMRLLWPKSQKPGPPPGARVYLPIQSSLAVSQERLKKHKQSFNSLLPEDLSSDFGLVLIIHSY